MRLHIRQVPFDFITEEGTKSSRRVAVGMAFLLVIAIGLLFATIFAAFAEAEEAAGEYATQAQSVGLTTESGRVLPATVAGVASVLLIGAARRRAAHLDI